MGTKARQIPAGTQVYSYVRFSSLKQEQGDSLRRQTEAAEKWCEENGLTLDTKLRMTDLGVSGFRGKNADVGALKAFLDGVGNGEIPKGSYLLIENLDRLSRDKIKEAFPKFLDIVNAGITIVTLSDGKSFGENVDQVGLMMAILVMGRAHEESQIKSVRRKERWKQDRDRMAEGKAVTSLCPEWLKKEGDVYVAIPERVETVRLLFKLRADGLGPARIVRRLNVEAAWLPLGKSTRKKSGVPPTPGWRESYVKKILTNRQVIGEHQSYRKIYDDVTRKSRRVPEGDPLVGYFPSVIDEQEFLAVQTVSKRGGSTGPTGSFTNVLRGLVICGYCGGPMHYDNKGVGPKGGQYLRCDNRHRRLGCMSPTMRYAEVEQAVLRNCHKIKPASVLPKKSDKDAKVEQIRTRLAGLKASHEDSEKRKENVLDFIEKTSSANLRSELDDRYVRLDDEIESLAAQIASTTSELAVAQRSAKDVEQWQSDIGSLIDLIGNKGNADLRAKCNMELQRYIQSIECFAIGHPEGKDDIACYIKAVILELGHLEQESKTVNPIDVESFIQFAEQQRGTRRGAFVRINFKTGLSYDLAIGPLSSGYSYRQVSEADSEASSTDWVSHYRQTPDIGELEKEFRSKNTSS